MEYKKEIKKCLACDNFVKKWETDSWKKYNEQRKYCSLECRKIWNKGLTVADPRVLKYVSKNTSMYKTGDNLMDKNKNWKGDEASYAAKHIWVSSNYGRADKCEICPAITKRYHWSNINNEYSRDIKDWVKLCPSCHKKFDLYKKDNSKYEKYARVYNLVLDIKK